MVDEIRKGTQIVIEARLISKRIAYHQEEDYTSTSLIL